MKVVVKNNRLALESRLDSLSDASDIKLKELARKFQIGLQSLSKTLVERNKDGRMVEEESFLYQNKPRAVLEDEIRKALKISLTTPKDYWTEAQKHAWVNNNIEEIQDASEERRMKEEAGIFKELKPFEKGLDDFATARLLHELTEEQWEYFKGVHNFYDKETGEKDDTGRVIRKRLYIHRLMPHEYIPENDEDLQRLRDMAKGTGPKDNTEAVRRSLEKYDKTNKSKTK